VDKRREFKQLSFLEVTCCRIGRVSDLRFTDGGFESWMGTTL